MAARERETPQEVMEEQYFGFARLSDEELQAQQRKIDEAIRASRSVGWPRVIRGILW